MRGTLKLRGRGGAHGGIIPAHAGNTRSYPSKGVSTRDHPRACGEHVPGTVRGRVEDGIIPAHAGNTAIVRINGITPWDHPRACGEHRIRTGLIPLHLGSSPRMRGTRDVRPLADKGDGIIPAHAGNTAKRLWPNFVARDHPRACGEHDLMVIQALEPLGSSPRMRGTPFCRPTGWWSSGIIPAHAGNTRRPASATSGAGDHPRACGEHN